MTLGRELRSLDVMNNIGLWMTWATLGHEIKALNSIYSYSYGSYEWLGVPWVQDIRYYEPLRVVDDMNDCTSWHQASRCYEWLRAMDDINNFRSWAPGYELKALNAMNYSRLWLTRMTLGHELRALNAMNNSRLRMTWMSPSFEPKALNTMNNSGWLWTWKALDPNLKVLEAINNSELCMIWTTWDPMRSSL